MSSGRVGGSEPVVPACPAVFRSVPAGVLVGVRHEVQSEERLCAACPSRDSACPEWCWCSGQVILACPAGGSERVEQVVATCLGRCFAASLHERYDAFLAIKSLTRRGYRQTCRNTLTG
uniref:Uncharacterized protein n=1 Tax=Parascaris univalens TaxID=6257 RepID=A0A915CLL0_PARUN